MGIYEFKTKVLKVTGTKQKIKWSTSNAKVAIVSQKGVVYAKTIGKAIVSATVGGVKKYSCIVSVVEQKAPRFTVDVMYGSDSYYHSAYTLLDFTNQDTENLYVGTMVMYDHVDLYSSISGTPIKYNTMGYAIAETEYATLKKFEGSQFITVGNKLNDLNLISYTTDTYYVFNRLESVISFSMVKGKKMYWYKYDCLLDQVKLTSKRYVNY